jgi:site-specific recombinase XerD
VLRADQALGMHHFAFLRAWLQGLDLKAAWQRYLAFGAASDDLRHIAHQRKALLRAVLQAGRQRNLGLAADARIDAALACLAQASGPPAGPSLPTLDEFAESQGLDPDHFSQAELLAEYQAFHGLDQAVQRQPAGAMQTGTAPAEHRGLPARIHALNQLEALLARAPQPGDPVALWFAPPTLARLQAVGAGTLDALLAHIDLLGHGWFRPVRGLGATRAAAVVAWLAPLAQAWGRPLRDAALQPPQRLGALRSATLQRLVLAPRFAIVPLQQLSVPAALAGGAAAPGLFATRMANSLGAADDLAAIRAWLALYRESPATHRAYAKEVERFYLWCLHVRRKPLSSVDAVDCQAYRQFLADPPAAWVQRGALPRGDPSWRPWRGPLAPSSQRYALVVVQTLFDGLRQANYLVANPMVSVRKKARLPEPALDTGRSFDEAEWAFLLGWLVQAEAGALARPALPCARANSRPPPGAEQRRLRLVLELLCGTGLRLAELVSASTAALQTVRVDGESGPDAQARVLTVVGKGGKLRQVPLDDSLQALIDAHHADAQALGPLPCPAPLVCTLRPTVGRWVQADEADSGHGARLQAGTLAAGRALGASGLYRALKRFFSSAAVHAQAVDGLSAQRLRSASTHWLRHTFGRQGAAAGVPVEVLQQAFGHASLNTTTTYLSTERSRMIRELRLARERRKAAL